MAEEKNILTQTAGHEAFHWLGTVDKQAQKELTDMIIRYLKNKDAAKYQEIYDQRAKIYKGRSQEYIGVRM